MATAKNVIQTARVAGLGVVRPVIPDIILIKIPVFARNVKIRFQIVILAPVKTSVMNAMILTLSTVGLNAVINAVLAVVLVSLQIDARLARTLNA